MEDDADSIRPIPEGKPALFLANLSLRINTNFKTRVCTLNSVLPVIDSPGYSSRADYCGNIGSQPLGPPQREQLCKPG
jgi:hypothetical protein